MNFMGTKKPLDIYLDVSGAEPTRHGPRLAVAIFLILLTVIALALFILTKPAAALPEGKITIYLQGSQPFLQGGTVTAQAFSSCGQFVLTLDGRQISYGEASVKAEVPLTAGNHVLQAKNSLCDANVGFTVLVPECRGSENRSCAVGKCQGNQKCSGGFYGDCMVPSHICDPGEKVGCSVDGCRFGYAACNDCGSGFGACLPRDSNTSAGATGSCSAPGCG